MAGFNMDGYVPVNERVDQFYSTFPDGSIQSEIVELTETRVTVKAFAYRKPDDPRPGIGHSSLGIPGSTPYTKGSEIENCETSAWGRAIAALGFEVKRGIASAEEVRNKPSQPARPRPPAESPVRKRLLAVVREHNIGYDAMEEYGRQVGIPAGEHGTDEQYEQVIALIESPGGGLPPDRPAPEQQPEREQSSTSATATMAVEPAPGDIGASPEVPADAEPEAGSDLLDAVLEATGGDLVEEKPEYVRKAEAMAEKVAAEKAERARKTAPDPEPLKAGL